MQLESPLALALIGLVYLLGFGELSYLRRQGFSARFALEGLLVVAIGTGLRYTGVPVHPLLFLVVLYVITMRVRLLVDVGNWFAERGQCHRALSMYNLGLRIGPDHSSRQLVLINHGVAQLKNGDPESAYRTLSEAVVDDVGKVGGNHLAAAYFSASTRPSAAGPTRSTASQPPRSLRGPRRAPHRPVNSAIKRAARAAPGGSASRGLLLTYG